MPAGARQRVRPSAAPLPLGVTPAATARLLLRAVTGQNLAVWIWDVHDLSDPATQEALTVAGSIEVYAARMPKPLESTG